MTVRVKWARAGAEHRGELSSVGDDLVLAVADEAGHPVRPAGVNIDAVLTQPGERVIARIGSIEGQKLQAGQVVPRCGRAVIGFDCHGLARSSVRSSMARASSGLAIDPPSSSTR